MLEFAYSGVLSIANLAGSNQYHYRLTEDWQRWHGQFRTVQNTLRLSLKSVPEQASLFGTPHRYYRFGQTGTTENVVGGNDAATLSNGSGSVRFTGEAIDFVQGAYTEDNFGYVEVGGPASDGEIISEYGNGVFCLGMWIQWGPNLSTPPRGHLISHDYFYFEDSGYGPLRNQYQARLYVDPNESALHFVCTHMREDGPPGVWTHLGAFRVKIPLNRLSMVNGQFYHLIVQVRVDSLGGAQAIGGEILIDGKLLLKSFQVQGAFYDEGYGFNASHQNIPFGPRDTIQIDTGGYKASVIGAHRRTEAGSPPSVLPDWSNEVVASPWNAAVDDVFILRESLFVPGNIQPRLVYVLSGNDEQWNTYPEFNQSWDSNSDSVFQPTRYPSLLQLGEESEEFILYGPVEETSQPSTGGITDIRIKFQQGLAEGRVLVSIRASDTLFDWNDLTVQWSLWNDLTDFNNVSRRIGGGGAGKYVQIRLRMLPNNSRTSQYAPAIQEIYFLTSDVANPENNPPTKPGQSYMWVNGNNSVGETVLVAQFPSGNYSLTWSPSTDADPDDVGVITYHVQVSSRADFAPDPFSQTPTILFEQDRIEDNQAFVPPEFTFGQFYWRVRAFDDRQFGEWSDVGTFRVNQPPAAPFDLAVVQLA